MLDLIITSIYMPKKVNVCEILSPESSEIICTDHNAILFDIHIRRAKFNRVTYDYQNANFDGLRAALAFLKLCDMISELEDITKLGTME